MSSAQNVDSPALQQRVSQQLKLEYQSALKRHHDPERAFSDAYERAVMLLSKATHVSKEKIRFEARMSLQTIMKDVVA